MAISIKISDERYQAIASLADAQGTTPEALIDAWLAERQEIEEERAFWGDDVINELRQQKANSLPTPTFFDPDDESFFRAISGGENPDANV